MVVAVNDFNLLPAFFDKLAKLLRSFLLAFKVSEVKFLTFLIAPFASADIVRFTVDIRPPPL
jgi:hypothetical protein